MTESHPRRMDLGRMDFPGYGVAAHLCGKADGAPVKDGALIIPGAKLTIENVRSGV